MAAVDPGPPELLVRILSTRRAHGSEGDKSFRLWLFNYLRVKLEAKPSIHEEGCILVTTDAKSTVLFSCHVDTVHSMSESDKTPTQTLLYDPNFAHLYLDKTSGAGCLGGDDGVGIYIMLEMIRRKVPGSYMFHTGEERGGIGARAYVAKNSKMLGERFEQVVAFDRPVHDDQNPEVIIAQGGRSCASEAYGKALAAALNVMPFQKPYVTSTRGVFTDSKLYADDVAECVNLGCFYDKQHTAAEVVDCFGVELLLEAACKIDWSKLPIERKAGPEVYESYRGGRGGFEGGYGGYGGYESFESQHKHKGWGGGQAPAKPPASLKEIGKGNQAPKAAPAPAPAKTLYEKLQSMSLDDLKLFVQDEPETAGTVLMLLLAKLSAQELENKLLAKALGLT